MKKSLFFLLALGISVNTFAQNKSPLILGGTKFTYPLVEAWITAYKQANPTASIKLVEKGQEGFDKVNVRIASYDVVKEPLKENEVATAVSRYALLPVANANNTLAQKAQRKGIKQEDLKKLFLEDPEDDFEGKKVEDTYQIYTRSAKVCSSITFANYLGGSYDDIVGKRIAGDDKHLLEAIKKDSAGITYSNASYLYDLKTRTLNSGILVLPVDLNGNGKLDKTEQLYQNLDVLLTYLEKNPEEKAISTEKVYFVTDGKTENEELTRFVAWIRNEGQTLSSALGFLNLHGEDEKSASIRTIKQ